MGLPARPKSPVDSKKEGDSSSIYSSSLPSSDGPEHSMSSSRTQVNHPTALLDQGVLTMSVFLLPSFTSALTFDSVGFLENHEPIIILCSFSPVNYNFCVFHHASLNMICFTSKTLHCLRVRFIFLYLFAVTF